jgi:enoyl-CoA hydratase/carnithine racemase
MDMPQLPEGVTLTREKGLAIVTLDRGAYGGGMNPLSAAAMAGLRDVARWLKTDIETHCVILTGARVFSIGADLKDPDMHTHHLDTLTQRQQLLLGPDMCAAWEALEQITICAMERFAIGGALALAVSCDWRIASEDCDIRLPEVPLGINMSWQANPRITVFNRPVARQTIRHSGRKYRRRHGREMGAGRYRHPGRRHDGGGTRLGAKSAGPAARAGAYEQAGH